MQPKIEITVLADEDGLMIKQILYDRLNLSRGLLRRMKNGGGVYLNGVKAFITQRVKAEDHLWIEFADSSTALEPQSINLDIIYQDEWILVVNKPSHLAVYPTRSYPNHTLANGLAYLWKQQGLNRKVRLLHRLDRDTSGIMVIAKDPYSYQGLVQQLRSRELKRKYLALVRGKLPQKHGIIKQPIGRTPSKFEHALKRSVVEHGKRAITTYDVLQQYDDFSLVQLELFTGRTHQIRVHLEWLGNPIIGDQMYDKATKIINRQALHAWSIEFEHPRIDKHMNFKVALPEDMLRIININNKNCSYRL